MRIDPRAGSGDLAPLLKQRGVKEVSLTQMAYGDVAIDGNGPEGMPIAVGVEVKKLDDLLQCIGNGRLVGHQLPGMFECYDVVWLLIEGIWREGREGLIEVPRGGGWMPVRAANGSGMALSLRGFTMTLEHKLGVKIMWTGTRGQSVDWLYHLNRWWTAKEWEEHKAHLQFDNSQAIALLRKPTLVQRMASQLPGIGADRSKKVAKRFHNVVDMVMAGHKDWQEIEGIGKQTAINLIKAMETDKWT